MVFSSFLNDDVRSYENKEEEEKNYQLKIIRHSLV